VTAWERGDGFGYARPPRREEQFDRTAHEALETELGIPAALLDHPIIGPILTMPPHEFWRHDGDALGHLADVLLRGNDHEIADAARELFPYHVRHYYGGPPLGERVNPLYADAPENDPSDVITGVAGKFSVADAAARTGHAPSTIRDWCSRHRVGRDKRGRYWLTDEQVEQARKHLNPPRVRRR
jgi:hypothetical protein